jgi:uncharacterized RDD family membrane protein YckC
MTGLSNPASDGDPSPQPQLSDLDVIVEPQSTSSLPELEPWRDEVAARLARYRARRKPRAPRYPSLLLPFESSETWHRALAAPSISTGTATQLAANPAQDESESAAEIAYFTPGSESVTAEPSPPAPQAAAYFPPESTAKIIEFPRSAAIPVIHTSTLADPIFDRPRIVEAPEVVLAPPALGGILIEPAPARPAENRVADAGIQSASIPRRLLATAVDGLILAASLSAFAAIFLRLNPQCSPLLPLVGVLAGFAVALWFVYQYLFIVYTGSTLGLLAAGLKLVRFDSSPVPRRLRRWRVLASMLSGFAAGLGYLWCFLDSDSLCWHDRITRTHLRPRK